MKSRRPPTTTEHLQERSREKRAGGYYSVALDQVEEVRLPAPPRVPQWTDSLEPRLRHATGESPRPGTTEDFGSGAPASRDTWADDLGRRPSTSPPPQVLVPRPLQSVALEWLRTGTLRLSPTTSARHARALQRAALLYLLMSHGYGALPDGLRRRAAWLFRPGWAEGATQADGDDLCFVLGLPADPAERQLLGRTAQMRIPREAQVAPSSFPGPRRGSRS